MATWRGSTEYTLGGQPTVAVAQGMFPSDVLSKTLMDRQAVTLALGTVAVFAAMVTAYTCALSHHASALLPMESVAAGSAATVLTGSVAFKLVAVIARPTQPMSSAELVMLSVHMVAAASNTIMYACPVPIVIDPFLGTAQHIVRWVEYVVLAFTMTFVVESMGSKRDLRDPLSLAILMSTSTACALVFPFVRDLRTWLAVMAVSCSTYATIFPRLYRRRKLFLAAQKRCMGLKDIESVVSARVSYNLILSCSVMWSVLVIDYFLVAGITFFTGEAVQDLAKRPQWPYIVDTIVEIMLKLVYAHIVAGLHSDRRVEVERQLVGWVRGAMDTIWEHASDVLIISEKISENEARTLASRSLEKIIGEEEAQEWYAWREHAIDTKSQPSDMGRGQAPTSYSAADLGVVLANTEMKKLSISTSDLSSRIGSAPGLPEMSAVTPLVDAQAQQESVVVPPAPPSDHALDSRSSVSIDGNARRAASRHESMESLVSRAWRTLEEQPGVDTCSLSWQFACPRGRDGAGASVGDTCGDVFCEVQVSCGDTSGNRAPHLILVVRDITPRVQLHRAEKKLLTEIAEKSVIAQKVAREKDEEANRFTRHEVKNAVLAAIAQCDFLCEHHVRKAGATADGSGSGSGSSSPVQTLALEEGLADLSSKLQQTLNTVLAEAIAKDLAHGNYAPQNESVDLEALFKGNLGSDPRFEVRTMPSPLPVVDMDPRLLYHVHRNAISNAVKYGREGAPVITEIELASGALKLRVINEPGEDHEPLLKLDDTSVIFQKGKRLHANSELDRSKQRISAGDGAWIMNQCAKALGGEVRIHFEHERTVFELSCPAKEWTTADDVVTFSVPEDTIAIGIDDSRMQRTVLKKIFTALGAVAERTYILGANDEEMLSFTDFVCTTVAANPEHKVIVIADENLELSGGAAQSTVSGSGMLATVQERLQPHLLDNCLLLVRSANDSRADCEAYLKCAHGVLAKGGFSKQAVAKTVAPAWLRRFGAKSLVQDPAVPRKFSLKVERGEELRDMCRRLDPTADWDKLRTQLAIIRATFSTVSADKGEKEAGDFALDACIEKLVGMESRPDSFADTWADVRQALEHALAGDDAANMASALRASRRCSAGRRMGTWEGDKPSATTRALAIVTRSAAISTSSSSMASSSADTRRESAPEPEGDEERCRASR